MPPSSEIENRAEERQEEKPNQHSDDLSFISLVKPGDNARPRENEKPGLPGLEIRDETKDDHRRRDQQNFLQQVMERFTRASLSSTSPDELRTLAADEHKDVRKSVAGNPNTPVEALTHLANDSSPEVRRELASHPNLPAELRAKLMKDSDPLVREQIAKRQDNSASALALMSKDKDWRVRSIVAQREDLDPKTLANLASDPEVLVRSVVAANQSTPRKALESIAARGDLLTNMRLAENPNVQAMAADQNATPQILTALAYNSTIEIKQLVAANPNTSIKDLANLMANNETRQTALNNPSIDRLVENTQQMIDSELGRALLVTDRDRAEMRRRLQEDARFILEIARIRRRLT